MDQYRDNYLGYNITRLKPSGYYETYLGNHFIKADSISAILSAIESHVRELAEYNRIKARLVSDYDLNHYAMFSDVIQCEIADRWANELGEIDQVEYPHWLIMELIDEINKGSN